MMTLPFTLPPELNDLGKAIGLLADNGDLDNSWFSNPLSSLQTILQSQTQREALVRLLDDVLPPETIPDSKLVGLGPNEKWHPLLQDQASGNLYLTVDDGNPFKIGIGGRYFAAKTTSSPGVSLTARLPVVMAAPTHTVPATDATVTVVAGTADGPFSLALAVTLGWSKANDGITLDGIAVALHLPAGTIDPAAITVTLQGLDIGDGNGVKDVVVDKENFETDAIAVIIGLISRQLKTNTTGPAQNLAVLLGLKEPVPIFPFTTLEDPHALTAWVLALVTASQSNPAPMEAWLTNFALLCGSSGPATTSPSGLEWSVPLVALGAASNNFKVELTVAKSTAADGVTPLLTAGIGLTLAPTAGAVRFDAAVGVIAVALAGSSPATTFPSASLIVTAPGSGSGLLNTTDLDVGRLRGGVRWDGSALKPLLELECVTLEQHPYSVIDLTNANSVVSAAATAFRDNIETLLGSSTAGSNLAALAGVIAPQADAGAPLVDPVQLAANPTAAIASLHRKALLSTAHPWSIYFPEIAELLKIPGPISGTGTLADPWVANIQVFGPLTLQLAAWNAQSSGNTADSQKLRIGLRALAAASGTAGALSGWWTSEVLAVDMPQTGANSIVMLGAHHAAIVLVPAGMVEVAGVSVSADSVSASLDLYTGAAPDLRVTISNLTVASADGTVTVPSLTYPLPPGFDITDPSSLGISVDDLEKIARGLLTRLLNKVFGSKGHALAVLLGVAPGAPGLQSDFPAIGGSGAPSLAPHMALLSVANSLFDDPVAAFQKWIGDIATGLSSEGTDYASSLVTWLSGLLAKALPDDVFTAGDLPKLEGAGTYDDPWRLPLGGSGSRAQGLLWLEPDGPPSASAAASALIDAAQDLPAFADVISGLLRYLPRPPDGLSSDTLAVGLQTLSDHFASTDGVVPVASQNPQAMNWPGGTSIDAAHPLQPSDPSAVAQIIAQIDSWTGSGNQRAVLLLGPAFSDHNIWTPLLTAVNQAHPGTAIPPTSAAAISPVNFNLRVPNVDPALIDLRGVTVQTDFYTADLQNDPSGSTTSLVTQIGLVLAQIASLRPQAKLMIVAHSTAGIAAWIYAAAHDSQIAGLVTLGTPFSVTPPPGGLLKPLTDSAAAEALRWIRHVFPLGVSAGKLKDAIDHLQAALDGYIAGQAGALPASWAYPIADFSSPPPTADANLHMLALGGQLGGGVDLLTELKVAAKAALGGFTALAPTHVAWGMRSELDLGIDSDISVDAAIRLDLGRFAVQPGAPEPPHAAQALNIDASLSRIGGWLVGSPLATGFGSPPVDVRVRSADLGVTVTLVNGVLTATPRATLNDASYHNVIRDLVKWGDAELEPLLGRLFQTVTATVPPGSALQGLLSVLEAAGVAAPDPHGGYAIATGAVNALTADAFGYLAPKIAAVLSSTAFTNPSPNQFVCALGNLPIEIFALTSPATVGVRTITSSTGIVLGDGIALTFSAALPLATMAPYGSAALAAGPATLRYDNETLTFDLPPLVSALELFPTAPSLASVTTLLEALVVSSGVSALIDSVLDPGYTADGLYSFLIDPGAWLVRDDVLGTNGVFDPAKINTLLYSIGQAIGGAQPGPGLTLPGGVTMSASGGDQNPTTLALSAQTPVGLAAFSLGLIIDATRHVTPQAAVTLNVVFPQTQMSLATAWTGVVIAFGVSASGVSLVVTPQGGPAIELLPSFGGAAALTGAAAMLLPTVLDRLVDAIGPSSARTAALAVAEALGIYTAPASPTPPTHGFSGHDAEFARLLDGSWFTSITRSQAIAAVVALFNGSSPLLPLPTQIDVSPVNSALKITYTPAASPSIEIELTAGWADSSGADPLIALSANYTGLSDAPLVVSLTCGYDGQFDLTATIGINLNGSGALGLPVVPEFVAGLHNGALTLDFHPLGTADATTIDIHLVPAFSVTTSSATAAVESLLLKWGIPLVANVLIQATQPNWNKALWSVGSSVGPAIGLVLSDAQLINNSNPSSPNPRDWTTNNSFNTPLLSNSFKDIVITVAAGALDAVASLATIKLSDTLRLGLISEASAGSTKLGVNLNGIFPLTRDSAPEISLLFGTPAAWPLSNPGISLFLFTQSGTVYTFSPELDVRGLGVGVKGSGDTPLINNPKFRVGAIDGYISFSNASGTFAINGGGVEIDQIGLPLNATETPNSSNAVASSLLGSNGGSGNGDGQAVNPGVDIVAYKFGNGSFVMTMGDGANSLVIPVHANLGPVYIDQIDVSLISDAATVDLVIGIDGSVKISALSIGIDDLAVSIPLNAIGAPDQWRLDLQGLAVGFSEGPIEIAGGLRKYTGTYLGNSFVEYDGMLSITIADIGLTIVGSYACPTDGQGQFTSLFVFGAVSMTLGGPPFMFITGLGAGGGYNRQLIAPTDMNQIGSFVLVSAIDDGNLANNPMAALTSAGLSFPPRRGAFWLAAGVRFTSFELVHSTVVVIVALDGGFEIDVLGISRMALPTEASPLASVELALKARYNSEENLLSVQAQLTDNSYLFSRDCQLTGGFAFFMWFSQGQFVLTLGGYNPAFSLPPQFPSVPRLGFNWGVDSHVIIKGGSYFALTNSCVMAGGALSATASFGPVSAWFDAYVDFLVAWDPFFYEFDVGIEIGARFQVQVCLWKHKHCLTINKSISLGASLAISGPPFHGTATVDLSVTTITVSFGSSSTAPEHITDWDVFAGKYLSVGGSTDSVVCVQFGAGLLPPDPPGAALQPGSETGPWKVGGEFTLTTTTRMPASVANHFVSSVPATPSAAINALDLAAMEITGVTSAHAIELDTDDGTGWIPVSVLPANFTVTAKTGFFPEAMWSYKDPHHLPAAARTITAIAGFDIDAHAVLIHESQAVPISKLVDDLRQYALALPFVSMAQSAPVYRGAANWAAELAQETVHSSSANIFTASAAILTASASPSANSARMARAAAAPPPEDVFARNRQMFGLPARGLAPLAAAALAKRSAPPLLAPLSTGLTLRSPPLAAATNALQVALVSGIALEQPRLRAVTQRVARPAADAPIAISTSAIKLPAAVLSGIPRMRPPSFTNILGAQLIKVPAPNAARPTKATLSTRTLRNADFGAAIGIAHQQAFAKAASDLVSTGVVLGSGAMHIWDVPDNKSRFTIAGDAAARMLCTDRAGRILRDLEFFAAGSKPQDLPAGTALVAIECLGALPPGTPGVVPSAGAITAAHAPAGRAAAVGWQSTNMLVQIGPTSFAGHGVSLKVTRRVSSGRRSRPASHGMLRADAALRGQAAVATMLPASVQVVIVMLDAVDFTAAQNGDLGIAVQGATLSSPPQRNTRGNRRCLCYDVTARGEDAATFTVSVASASAWTVAGVIGVQGKAIEWAARFATGTVDNLIQDGALAPGGSLTVTCESATP